MTETYHTGKPCRNGHDSPRYKATGLCVECKKEKSERHYALHRDVRIDKALAYHQANREVRLQQMRQNHFANHAEALAYRRAYHEKNREHLLQVMRARNATPEAKAAKAAKRKAEAHLYRGYEQKRRARLKGAVPPWFGELDEFVLAEAAELCVRRAAATGLPWEIDHMIPLLATRASGLHCATNTQVIPQWLNRSKNRRMILTQPGEWIRCV